MKECKPVNDPIPVGVRLSVEKCPKIQEEEEAMSRVPYASVVGRLMYAMVCTRPNIAHAMGVLIRYMSKPRKEHCIIVKRVFRYLSGTIDHAIYYQGKDGPDKVLGVHGFIDADWDEDLDYRISTSGYVFNLFGGAITWMSMKRDVVALLTIEINTWEELMQVKRLHACRYCVQKLVLNNKL